MAGLDPWRNSLYVWFWVVLLLSSPLWAKTLEVGEGAPFVSIQSALNSASHGDTILVRPGRYHETLTIEESVRLVGQQIPHIEGTGQGNVITINADEVLVRGFRVSGSGNRMMHSDSGIKILGQRVRIEENQLFDNLFGVYLKKAKGSWIEGNSIEGRKEMDLGRRGAGIHLYDAHNNTIRNNRVRFVRDGVYFDHSDFNAVERNHFSRLRYGVHYMYCKDNRFYGNVFRDSLGGAAVMYTERVEFRENRFVNHRQGHNAFGLLLKDCLDSVAARNLILNNVNGIFIDNSHRNQFTENLVAYNDTGVLLYASSLENRFWSNDFIGNLATLLTVGRARAEWSREGRGNFYSDYRGYDLNADGIGDVSHRLQNVFEYLEGNRPLFRLYLNSAVADALVAAEKGFPIIPSSNQQDPFPRMRPVSGVSPQAEEGRTAYRFSALSLASVLLLLWIGYVFWSVRA